MSDTSTVDAILKDIKFCNLATVCPDGSPWNSPVFFVSDNQGNFYWWSAVKAQHSQNVNRSPQVFITVYDSTVAENEAKAVYVQATAKQLTDESEIAKTMELYNRRAKLFQLDDNLVGGAAPTRLFMAKPEKVWINDEDKENGYYIDIRKQLQ